MLFIARRHVIRTGSAFVVTAAGLGFAATPGSAEEYFGLVVHGGGTTHTSYDKGVLRVEFRHSRHPAGDSLHYEQQVPSGQAAWPDRPMSPQEPSVLLQKLPGPEAARIIDHLNGRGYWMFYCHNTGSGTFEVLKSNEVSASIKFD